MKWNRFFNRLADQRTSGKPTWTFRTDIMCNGCIAKVKPILDSATGIDSWKVDLKNPDRLLTVVSDGITRDEVMALIQNAGFTIVPC